MTRPRAFGDIVNIRQKLRRVIRRGQAILDELEGGRQSTSPEADSGSDSFFKRTAVHEGLGAIHRWRESILDLVALHLPSLQESFSSPPMPKPKRGLPSLDILDAFDAYVRDTVGKLEAVLDSLANEARPNPLVT